MLNYQRVDMIIPADPKQCGGFFWGVYIKIMYYSIMMLMMWPHCLGNYQLVI
jgi:hypothetical protein